MRRGEWYEGRRVLYVWLPAAPAAPAAADGICAGWMTASRAVRESAYSMVLPLLPDVRARKLASVPAEGALLPSRLYLAMQRPPSS